MTEFTRLTGFLPAPPSYRFDWPGLMGSPLGPFIEKMSQTPQNPEWHAEGDVWTHTKLVCEALTTLDSFRALSLRSQQELALAALLHDVGKIRCTRLEDGILVSPRHAAVGAQISRSLLWREFGLSGDRQSQIFRETVCQLIRYHTRPIHLVKNEDGELLARKIAANGETATDFSLNMLCLLAEADVLGRDCSDREALLESVQLSRMLCEDASCLDAPFPFPSPITRRSYLSGGNVWPYQPLFDDTWGEVVLLCGLPGTGKDTWIAKMYPDMPVVSLDDFRRKMDVGPGDDQGAVVQAANEQARIYLRGKRPFIWNATSLTPMLRGKNIRLFEEYGASVRIVWLETGWEENLLRNRDRVHSVPESVIGAMLDKFIPPEVHEAHNVEWRCI